MQDVLRYLAVHFAPDLRSFLGTLDLSGLRVTNTAVVDEFFQRSLGDKVWEIPFRNENGEHGLLRVALLFECQSSIDWLMPLRVQGYSALVQKAAFKDRAPKKGDRLQPVLAIVVYNGVAPWTAERTVAGMVYRGPATDVLPEAPPLFAGERYELVDIRAHMRARKHLTSGNVFLLVMRIEAMADREGEPGAIVEEIVSGLAGPRHARLRKTLLKWFALVARRHEVDLDFLQDEEAVRHHMATGTIRTFADECFARRFAVLRAQGRQEGIERGMQHERNLLRRLAERKFGAQVGHRVAGMLATIDDPAQLEDVGDWIIDCEDGDELLARIG